MGYFGRDIIIDAKSDTNYLLTIRDSYFGHSRGCAIYLQLQTAYLYQTIRIINNTIDESAYGIRIQDNISPDNEDTMIYLQIIIENCIIMNNTGAFHHSKTGSGLLISGQLGNSPVSVILRNVSFMNNNFSSNGGIHLNLVSKLKLIDCVFVGNQGTPISLFESSINVSGTLSFVNNTAYEGGAMAFYGKSYMSVSLEKNTQILFINNYAEHVGGAIFADEQPRDHLCFLQLATHNSKCSDLNNNRHLSFVFTNNTAQNGGDAIYGGSLQHCIAGQCKYEESIPVLDYYGRIPILGAYFFIVNYWNLVQYDTGQHSNLSLISSTPSRVCLCEDGEPDCLTMFKNDTHYPGETFSISAVVVGQGFGTVDGTVYAQFTNKDTPVLEELQQSQQVNHSSCAKVKYTVFSATEKEIMVLSTSTTISEYDPEYVDFAIKK